MNKEEERNTMKRTKLPGVKPTSDFEAKLNKEMTAERLLAALAIDYAIRKEMRAS